MSEELPDGPDQGAWTVDEYRQLDEPDKYELLQGELHPLPPADALMGRTTGTLAETLRQHVEERAIGAVLAPRPAVVVEPDSVVRPDIAFVRSERAARLVDEGTVEGVPDLVVEILTDETRRVQLLDKREFYEEVGVDWVLYVEPRERAVEICRRDDDRLQTDKILGDDDTLQLELFPGLAIDLEEIWVEP